MLLFLSSWDFIFLTSCFVCFYTLIMLFVNFYEFYNLVWFGLLGGVSMFFVVFFFISVFICVLFCNYFFFKLNFYDVCYGDYVILIFIFLTTLLFVVFSLFLVVDVTRVLICNLLLCIFVLSNFFYFNVNDCFFFFIILEFQTMVLYIFYNIKLAYSGYYVRAGIRFFVLSVFMSLLLLLGISFIYIGSGTFILGEFNLLDTVLSLRVVSFDINFFFFKSGLMLIYGVFLFKLGLFPFYVWMLEVFIFVRNFYFILYILISKIPIFFFFSKFIVMTGFFYVLIGFFIISIFVGVLSLYREGDLKKFIIYSSMVQYSVLCLCLDDLNYFLGVALVSLYFNYIFVFMSVYGLCDKIYGSCRELLHLNGLFLVYKPVAVFLCLCLLSVIGIPPFFGFIGKLYLFYGFLVNSNLCVCFFMVIVSVISSVYYFNIVRNIIFGRLVKNTVYVFSYSWFFVGFLYLFILAYFYCFFILIDLSVF